VARQAGRKHAAVDARVIAAKAAAKASGSRGLTRYKRVPSRRVRRSARATPIMMPVVVRSKPRSSTRRSTFDVPAPRAIRNPNSRVLCETVYDITPYRPMLASSRAKPPNRATKATATSCWDVERSTCSCSVIISDKARLGSSARTSPIRANVAEINPVFGSGLIPIAGFRQPTEGLGARQIQFSLDFEF